MAVIFDNTASATIAAGVSITTASFAVTANPNRAALLALSTNNGNNITGITASLGGVNAVAVPGADSGATAQRVLMFSVTAPPSGSQTATVSWTGNADGTFGAVTASGVDQNTPVTNGTSASGSGATTSVTITSNAGDLTVDAVEVAQGAALTAPTQTPRWNVNSSGNQTGAGSTGPGSGTATHQWTNLGATWVAVGANFKALILAAPQLGRQSYVMP